MTKTEEMEKYTFGVKGIWHKPASENTQARDIPATVLEAKKMGVIYIFTTEPIIRGYDSLTNRTATIFPSNFTILSEEDFKNAL